MAFYCVRPTGTLLVVGCPQKNFVPPDSDGRRRDPDQGVRRGTREDLREVLAMGAAGTVRCQLTTRRLADVGEVFGQLSRGEVTGRAVLRLRD